MRMPGLVRWRWTAAVLGGLLAAALPHAARAQSVDEGLRADSAGIPDDTVRLHAVRVRELEECKVLGYRVVSHPDSAARMRRWPQCADADFGDLSERTLVGVTMFGDCHARYHIDAWRSESRREYRVRVTERYGGCRAARGYYAWVALPRLPDGWRVAFTHVDVDDDLPGSPGPGTIPFPFE